MISLDCKYYIFSLKEKVIARFKEMEEMIPNQMSTGTSEL